MAKISKENILCPVELTLRVIGGKWKGFILWQLREKTFRFGELRKKIIEGIIHADGNNAISEKVLTQALRELEKDDIVERKVYRAVPPKVEYSLTEYGKTLSPLLDTIFSWGIKEREKLNIE